ncbi:hypothetical protein KCU73_g1115, partial [Aureobasidium melanogenum]
MKITLALAAGAASVLASSATGRNQFSESSYSAGDIIERDFAIIGGGAAGTYAAVSLADKNRSFTLVEITDRLGGHARTFTDPARGVNVDFGVQLYLDTPVVRNFFNRLDTPLANFNPAYFGNPNYFDFNKQIRVNNYSQGTLGTDYVAQLDRYPYLENGIDLPNPVPADLLLTWPEYIEKYNLGDSAESIFATPANPGDVLQDLALYMFNDLNHVMLSEDQGAAILNANYDNSELYVKALAELHDNVLLMSSVTATKRGSNAKACVKVVVKTPTGNKLIVARQLILAMPPLLNSTKQFDLDAQEQNILAQINGKYYYGGVVNNTGLKNGNGYINIGADTPYHVASLPGVVQFTPSSAPGYFFYWYNTLQAQTRSQVESATLDTIKWLQNQINETSAVEPNFVDFQDFSPFHLEASKSDIANGFYRKMNGLQGHKNTWYIGSLFVVGTSQVWNNTKNMLPEILAAAEL